MHSLTPQSLTADENASSIKTDQLGAVFEMAMSLQTVRSAGMDFANANWQHARTTGV